MLSKLFRRLMFFVLADLGKSPLAIEAVRRIDEIFAIEREINGLTAEQRLAARRKRVAPLVDKLKVWMLIERARLSRHADTAKAMEYMLKRWPAFMPVHHRLRFLTFPMRTSRPCSLCGRT